MNFAVNYAASLRAPRGPRKLRARPGYSGRFDPVSPGELWLFPLDFTSRLAPGDSLGPAAPAASLTSREDPNAANLAAGGAFSVGNVAMQWIGHGLAGDFLEGADYRLTFTVATTLGGILIGFADIPCPGEPGEPATPPPSTSTAGAPTPLSSSTTITTGGVYILTEPNLVITLAAGIVGQIAIIDGTNAADPNSEIVGAINGAANVLITAGGQSVVLTPGLAANSWNILA